MFTEINGNTWERREYFQFFKRTVIHTSLVLDITDFLSRCKSQSCRFYPAMIFALSQVANGNPEFRFGYNEQKMLGIWDRVDPVYTVPRRDASGLFTMKHTSFTADFDEFYKRCTADMEKAGQSRSLFSDETVPPNTISITAVPGLPFRSLGFSADDKEDLAPFIILGGYYKEGSRMLLPVSGEFAHAVNDGNHISYFFSELEAAYNRLLL